VVAGADGVALVARLDYFDGVIVDTIYFSLLIYIYSENI
jgi:hypothetical protein